MTIVVLPLEVKAHRRRRPNAARDERNPEEEAAGMDGDPRRVDARATNAPSQPVRAPSPMLPPGETAVQLLTVVAAAVALDVLEVPAQHSITMVEGRHR